MPSPAFFSLARSRVFQATPLTTFLAVIGLVVSATACAETLVVTDSRHPVAAPEGVRVILLDEPEQIQQMLSADLPHDSQAAAALVQRRLGGPAGKAILERLRLAHQGVTDAWSLQIAKIPAVVVDRKYVVYGYRDVALVESLVEAYRQGARP